MKSKGRTVTAILGILVSVGAVSQEASTLDAAAKVKTASAFVEQATTELCPELKRTLSESASTAEAAARSATELECARTVLRTAPIISANSTGSATKAVEVTQVAQAQVDAKNRAATRDAADAEFLGFNWGLGIGYGFGRGPDRVSDAEVVNGIVRVKEDRTDGIRAVLEAHHFFEVKRGKFGIGPFASVQLGDDGASAVAFSLGLMVGWKDQGDAHPSAGSWNLGIGYEFGQDVKTLGDGIVANQPLPDGETQVRYKTQPADAILVFFSRRFRMEPIK